MEPKSSTTTATSKAGSIARLRLAHSMSLRRSSRSASAPAVRAKRSQGSVAATDSPAISVGDCVTWMASSGSAILKTPSARLDRPDEVQSFQ